MGVRKLERNIFLIFILKKQVFHSLQKCIIIQLESDRGDTMLDYIIIGLLIVVIILVIISIVKNINEANITERLGKLETEMIKELSTFQTSLSKNLGEDFENQSEKIEYRLRLINDKVNERLDENFEKTNKTQSAIVPLENVYCN